MLLPLSDDNTGRQSTPYIVYLFLAINIAVFLLQWVEGDRFTLGYAAVPYEITHNTDLIGSRGGIPQAPGPSPIWLTLFTSMFMHGGLMHIAGNMLFLWVFGDNVEDNFGHIKFVIFYVICGLLASFSQILLEPNSVIPTLGASGAIAGVLGAYLVMFPKNRVHSLLPLGIIWTMVNVPAWVMIGLWIVLQFFSQVAAISSHTAQARGGGVAYMAHIGGFIGGMVLCFLFRNREREFVRVDADNDSYHRPY
ncbi:MAG: rhomboid family intramembrane serine protease [Acidobacteria bacterium]|nr:rhomboid family intramembrane serine protease [Acidobacteriota bacterium]